MEERTLKFYMARAGIRSNRELSALTGIKHTSLDAIIKRPLIARGYQIRDIAAACGMSDREVVTVFTETDRRGR